MKKINIPEEINGLNLPESLKKYIAEKGIETISELKKIRYNDFDDCSKRKVDIILREVDPKAIINFAFEYSERLKRLKQIYTEELGKENRYAMELKSSIKNEILNAPIDELNLNLPTTLELKENNITKLREILEYLYNEDGSVNYFKSVTEVKKIIELADLYNLPIKNDPRVKLLYNKDLISTYKIEVLNLPNGIQNLLKLNNINFISDLLSRSDEDLRKILGAPRVKMVKNQLDYYDLNLLEENNYIDEDNIKNIERLYKNSKNYII